MRTARPSLVLVPQYFGALLFDRRTSRYLPFDRDAARVLRALADRAADDVVRQAAQRGDAEHDDVIALLDALGERGFLRLDGRLAAQVLEPAGGVPADHLAGPLAVHLEVIGACNLTCTHCFAGELPRNHDPLTLREMDALFHELASLGSFRLGLTGGEPLLRKDLFEILDAATGAGLHPCLTTNALLVDERVARELGKRDLVWLNVSLEGAVASTNDAVRGDGVYARVLEKLAILREHARFTLAFTLTSDNLDEVEACAALAEQVGAHTAVFRPLYPVGTAVKAPELMPTFAQYTNALARIGGHARASPGASTSDASICASSTRTSDLFALDPFSPDAREELRGTVMANAGCGAANTVASINVQGRVSPCSFLGAAFEDGSIRTSSFGEIWRRGHAFRRFRASVDERGDVEAFAGGCRARAQFYAGSVHARDPWQDAHDVAHGGVAPTVGARGSRERRVGRALPIVRDA